MSSHSEDDKDDPWQKLDSLIELQFGGDEKPLLDYLLQNDSNGEWRKAAINHLIKTCGHVLDGLTMEKIWLIAMLCKSEDHKDSAALIAFFETKWEQSCKIKEKRKSENEQKLEYAMASAHGLLGILASLHNEQAIE